MAESLRSPPTIVCNTCGKRKRKKGAIRSRYTGAYFCADCTKRWVKGEV